MKILDREELQEFLGDVSEALVHCGKLESVERAQDLMREKGFLGSFQKDPVPYLHHSATWWALNLLYADIDPLWHQRKDLWRKE